MSLNSSSCHDMSKELRGGAGLSEPAIYNAGDDDRAEVSDADSEYREFATGISSFRQSVLVLREPMDHSSQRSPRDRIRRRGARRGPRKAVEPSGEVKLRLGKANQAFVDGRYVEAASLASEVVRLNAEVFEAWTLMASAFKELGDLDNSLKALLFAAHLQPKVSQTWLQAAQQALEETGPLRSKYLVNAQFAYAGAIRADPRNLQARMGKAYVCIERGQFGPAISEYKYVLSRRPYDLEMLHKLAELSIDYGEIQPIIAMYRTCISHFQSCKPESERIFGWTDLDSYITLFELTGQYEIAIRELRSVARWLLGREEEVFWDDVTEDDREWDQEDTRRVEIADFVNGQYPTSSYGDGLPKELRLKLALYRLKAGHQTEAMTLDLVNDDGCCRDSSSSSLFRLMADHFQEAGLYEDALELYQIMAKTAEVDSSTLVQMGKCLLQLARDTEAMQTFKYAIQVNQADVNARMELAKFYERIEKPMEAFLYINEAMLLRRTQINGEPRTRHGGVANEQGEAKSAKTGHRQKRLYAPYRHKPMPPVDDASKAEHLKGQFHVLIQEHDRMRLGELAAMSAWMEAAKDLTDDFRSFRTFYPWDKYIKFLGYSHHGRTQAETLLDFDLSAMAKRLSQVNLPDTVKAGAEIPSDYRGVSFNMWLDIFLEYAMCLARSGDPRGSYELCEAAKDAVVFYHSREDMFLIHICWCMCSLFSNDEETCVSVARFFMKDYQFTTDSYRMFGAIARVCHSPVSWYSSGPSQKYILRQIKAMDYELVDDARKNKYFAEKGSYTARDLNGMLIVNSDMDIALLMLYGHILFAGTSYGYALNYFFRAHALDPTNPLIHLNLGLAYIHHALKRQSDNRQHNILQGIGFMLSYYNSRRQSKDVAERQEAHYNMGRTYQLLGLVHLAVPYFIKVLDEASSRLPSTREDVATDAAYNLQLIYVNNRNIYLAKQVSLHWLQI